MMKLERGHVNRALTIAELAGYGLLVEELAGRSGGLV